MNMEGFYRGIMYHKLLNQQTVRRLVTLICFIHTAQTIWHTDCVYTVFILCDTGQTKAHGKMESSKTSRLVLLSMRDTVIDFRAKLTSSASKFNLFAFSQFLITEYCGVNNRIL